MRALVVDDDEEVLVFAAEALNSFAPGFDVATARDLEEAVLWLDVFSPDILLLNPELCGGNVLKMAERLKADHRTRNCKIVAVSTGKSARVVIAPAEIGADAALAKPLQLQALLDTVRLLVGPSLVDPLSRNDRLSRDPSRTV